MTYALQKTIETQQEIDAFYPAVEENMLVIDL